MEGTYTKIEAPYKASLVSFYADSNDSISKRIIDSTVCVFACVMLVYVCMCGERNSFQFNLNASIIIQWNLVNGLDTGYVIRMYRHLMGISWLLTQQRNNLLTAGGVDRTNQTVTTADRKKNHLFLYRYVIMRLPSVRRTNWEIGSERNKRTNSFDMAIRDRFIRIDSFIWHLTRSLA